MDISLRTLSVQDEVRHLRETLSSYAHATMIVNRSALQDTAEQLRDVQARLQTIAAEYRVSGASDAEILELLELFLQLAPHAALQQEVLGLAVPPRGRLIGRAVAVKVCGLVNWSGTAGAPRALLLDWLLGVWDLLDDAAFAWLRRCYFVFFRLVSHESLSSLAAFVLLRLTRAEDVLLARVAKLAKAFDRSPSPELAALLFLCHSLRPELFALPFNPAIFASPTQLRNLISSATPATQSQRNYAQLRAKRHASVPPRRNPSALLVFPDLVPERLDEPFPTKVRRISEEVIPPVSYIVDPAPLRARVFLDNVRSAKDFCRAILAEGLTTSRAAQSLVGAFVCPDHLVSALHFRTGTHYIAFKAMMEPEFVDRLQQWIIHVVQYRCLDAPIASSKDIVPLFSEIAYATRELPPTAERALTYLLGNDCKFNLLAIELLQWVPLSSLKDRHQAVLEPLLKDFRSGPPSVKAMMIYSLADMIRRMSVPVSTPYIFTHGSRPALLDFEFAEPWCEAAAYCFNFAKALNTEPVITDALLHLLEVISSTPLCKDFHLNRDFVMENFVSSSTSVSDRMCSIVARFAKHGNPGAIELRMNLRAELIGVRSERLHLFRHPAYKHYAKKLQDNISAQFNKMTHSTIPIFSEAALVEMYLPKLCGYLALRGIKGVQEIVLDEQPVDSDNDANVSESEDEEMSDA